MFMHTAPHQRIMRLDYRSIQLKEGGLFSFGMAQRRPCVLE